VCVYVPGSSAVSGAGVRDSRTVVVAFVSISIRNPLRTEGWDVLVCVLLTQTSVRWCLEDDLVPGGRFLCLEDEFVWILS
jgi:hypothetical protein